MERKWASRAYQPGDEAGIGALWQAAFPHDAELARTGLAYWHWLYRDPPAGPGRIRLAVAEGEIVGHYAVIPVQMQVRGQSVLGTLSLDTMTHPHYQRQGILITLARELYGELGRDHLPLTYGFPNENSVGALTQKLGWDYVCALPVYVKPLRPDRIARRLLPGRLLAAMARPVARLGAALISPAASVPQAARRGLHWLPRFDGQADALWEAVYDPARIALTRSARFLNWRYPDNPLRRYHLLAYQQGGRLLAYAVLRGMEQFGLRGGMILELIGHPGRDEALAAVLAAAEEHFRQEQMDLVACLLHGDPRAVRLLRKRGFLRAPRRAFKEWHFCVRRNNGTLPRGPLADAANWYVTFGDTDVI